MGRSRNSAAPATMPVHATRRNTANDRKAGAGSVMPGQRQVLKRGGAGAANWGRPGDELYDYEEVDYTELSAEEAVVTAAGLKWSEVDELSGQRTGSCGRSPSRSRSRTRGTPSLTP